MICICISVCVPLFGRLHTRGSNMFQIIGTFQILGKSSVHAAQKLGHNLLYKGGGGERGEEGGKRKEEGKKKEVFLGN